MEENISRYNENIICLLKNIKECSTRKAYKTEPAKYVIKL